MGLNGRMNDSNLVKYSQAVDILGDLKNIQEIDTK